MKCLVISPTTGTMRISRFTTDNFEDETARSADFDLINETHETEAMNDLHGRSIAPLRLSAALRARLPSLLQESVDG